MLVLHIGYAKAGPAFLQRRVFPNIPQIHYVGKRHGNESSASQSADWVYDFVFGDDISMERFAETIHEETAGKSAINVVSHEDLLRPYKKYRLLQRIKKLKEYFEADIRGFNLGLQYRF